jgi:hypothetical protein
MVLSLKDLQLVKATGLALLELLGKFTALAASVTSTTASLTVASLTASVTAGSATASLTTAPVTIASVTIAASRATAATAGAFVELFLKLALEDAIVRGFRRGNRSTMFAVHAKYFLHELDANGFTFEEVIMKLTFFELEIEIPFEVAGQFVVVTGNKRVLSLETVGNNGGDGTGNEENRGGNLHLDHDGLRVVVIDRMGGRRLKF